MLSNFLGRRTVFGQLRYQLLDRHYNQTIRVGLVAFCVGITLLSTVLFRDVRLFGNDFLPGLLPILLVLALMLVVVFYNHMQGAVLLAVVMSTLLFDGFGTGTDTKISFTFVLLCVLVAIWLFRVLVVERRLAVRPSPANVPAIVFMLLVVLSAIWSAIYVDQAVSYLFAEKLIPRLMTGIILIVSPLTYFLFANNIRSINGIKFIVWWFIGAGTFFAFLRLIGDLPPIFNMRGQFPTWVAAFAIGQSLFNKSLPRPVRLGLLVVTAAWIYITLGLGASWLSGWLPLSVVAGILIAFYSRRWLVVGLIVVAVYLLSNVQEVTGVFSTENTESGETRSVAWVHALDIYKEHFLFGTGPAGYAYYFETYLVPANFSHNNYIDIISQTGIFGFLAFVAFWIGVAIMALRTYFSVPRQGFIYGAAASLLAANISTFVTMMLGDWVTPFTYTQGLNGIDYTIWAWILAGTTTALYYVNKQAKSDAERGIVELLTP